MSNSLDPQAALAAEEPATPIRSGATKAGLVPARISLLFMLCFFTALAYLWHQLTSHVPDEERTMTYIIIFGSFVLWTIFAVSALYSKGGSFSTLQSLKTCIVLAALIVAALLIALFGGLLHLPGVTIALEVVIAGLFLLMILVMIKQNYDDTHLPSLTVSLSVLEGFLFLILAAVLFFGVAKALDPNSKR